MDLSAWLRQQIAMNNAVLYRNVGGIDVPVTLDEAGAELDRRLAGLSYAPRIISSSRVGVETLAAARAASVTAAETQRQSGATMTRAVIESEKGDKRGRPSTKCAKVMNQMIAGINAEKYTWEQLQGASQRWIKGEFDCHHNTYWKALAKINLANTPSTRLNSASAE